MHQNGFVLFYGVLDEIVYGLGGIVLGIKYYLVLEVQPLEGQIHYAPALPKVLHLLACAVDYVRYFIGEHELLVL